MGSNVCFVIIGGKKIKWSNIVTLKDFGRHDSGDLKYNDKGNFSPCKKEQFISLLRQAPSAPLLYCCVFSPWPGGPLAKTNHEAVLQNSLTLSSGFQRWIANWLQAMILVQSPKPINSGTFTAFMVLLMQRASTLVNAVSIIKLAADSS